MLLIVLLLQALILIMHAIVHQCIETNLIWVHYHEAVSQSLHQDQVCMGAGLGATSEGAAHGLHVYSMDMQSYRVCVSK